MVIYGEYLFAENFIAGLLLILLTGKVAGYMPSAARALAAAVLCGLSGFIIFLPVGSLMSAAVRIGAGAACAAAAFGLRNILKTSAILLVLTFLSGGAAMAILLWRQEPVISHQGIIYMDAVTYLWLLFSGILAFGLTYWFVRLIRGRAGDIAASGRVCLVIDGKPFYFRAFVDSGNQLREPLTDKPVVLIDKRGAEKLPFKVYDLPQRYRVIPYKAVGVDKGSLDGLRTDMIMFRHHRIEEAYVAFYQGTFGDFEVLLNRDFLEGGLLQDV